VATMQRSVRAWGAAALGLGTVAPTLALSLTGRVSAAGAVAARTVSSTLPLSCGGTA
jgi:hypothetical protein